jgi:hypothetical protein
VFGNIHSLGFIHRSFDWRGASSPHVGAVAVNGYVTRK